MKKLNISKYLIIVLFFFFTLSASGQMLEPDDPGGDPVGEDPLGGGAPVSGGTLILISMGMAYGARKFYKLKKPTKE